MEKKVTILIKRPNYETTAKWHLEAEKIWSDTDTIWLNPFASDTEVEEFLQTWTHEDCVRAWKEFIKKPSNKFTWSGPPKN
jgi:hypothetical protein